MNEEDVMTASITGIFYGSAADVSYADFAEGVFMFADKWTGHVALDNMASRVKNLYNDVTFRVMVYEYRETRAAQHNIRKRMFDDRASGDTLYNAADWDENIYEDRVQAYEDVLYDLLVTIPQRAKGEL